MALVRWGRHFRQRWKHFLAFALVASEALYLYLHFLGEAPFRVDQYVGVSLLLSILYLFMVFLLLRFSEQLDSGILTAHRLILIGAILFRLTAFPLTPFLSDDLYRYRWEGKLQAEGGNPYQVAPANPAWERLRDETYQKIPVRDFPGGYGPVASLVEWATYEVADTITNAPAAQIFVFKVPAVLGDVATMLLLLGWLRTRQKPLSFVAVYALCPLTLVEFWGMGHNDAIAIAFLVGAFWAMDARREFPAFFLLGMAVAVKWWPALVLPAFIGLSRDNPRRTLLAGLGLLVVPLAFLPYWSDVSQNLKFMGGFAGGWRNNDSLFGITFQLAGEDFDTAKWWTLRFIAALSVLAGCLIREREKAAVTILAGTLLLSANCHPWYLTWLLPFLVFVPWPPLLLWVSLVPLFYEVLIDFELFGIWNGSRAGRWLVYVPVFGMMLAYFVRYARQKRDGRGSMRPTAR